MTKPRVAQVLFAWTLLLPALQGCVGFYHYRDMKVTVTDRATGAPVQGVAIRTVYQADLPGLINDPRVAHAVTGEDGAAVMSIASWWSSSLVVGEGEKSQWFQISEAFATDEGGKSAFFGHDSKALTEQRELTYTPLHFVSDISHFQVTIAPAERK